MENKTYPIVWGVKSHSYPIGDTGDYDGYWEITNGKDSLIAKEDYDDIEKDLQSIVDLLNSTYANLTVDRGAEAALDAENKWLQSELSTLKAQQAGVWVKASEFKSNEYPVYRPYRRKRWKDEEHGYDYGEIYITEDNGYIFLDVDNAKEYEPQSFECWNDFEILDESPNAYQELKERAQKLADALLFFNENGLCSETTEVISEALNAWNGNGQKKEGEDE